MMQSEGCGGMGVIDQATLDEDWDEEWVQLLQEARELGITIHEVRVFLSQRVW